MKTCTGCRQEKDLGHFYKNGKTWRSTCKTCFNKKTGDSVAEWRRRTKRKLVAHHGSKCVGCDYAGPAFMYDFDHKDPQVKSFNVSASGNTFAYERILEESLKCDLLCANCHRMRTHKQRCPGCEYC